MSQQLGWIRLEFVIGDRQCAACGAHGKGKYIVGESKFGNEKRPRQVICVNCGRDVVIEMFEGFAGPAPPSLLKPGDN